MVLDEGAIAVEKRGATARQKLVASFVASANIPT